MIVKPASRAGPHKWIIYKGAKKASKDAGSANINRLNCSVGLLFFIGLVFAKPSIFITSWQPFVTETVMPKVFVKPSAFLTNSSAKDLEI